MGARVPGDRITRLRFRSHGLTAGEQEKSVESVVSKACGLQAQDENALALAVRVRGRELLYQDVNNALGVERAVVRTWCMRGTIHLVTLEDLKWLLPLFGPVFAQRDRARLSSLGLKPRPLERALKKMTALLDNGPLSRKELEAGLNKGRPRNTRYGTQAVYHLIRQAALRGQVVQSGGVGKEPRYERLPDEWVLDGTAPGTEALARLASRFVAGYGPVSLADLASWSGLPMRTLRPGWDHVVQETHPVVGDGSLRTVHPPEQTLDFPPFLRLLPAFDNYLGAYKDRRHAVKPEHDLAVRPGGGVIRATVVLDGQVVGTWGMQKAGDARKIQISPLRRMRPSERDSVEQEAEDIARFFDSPVRLDYLSRPPGKSP